jgi:murein DD-endopeptidase MepM/ murein hydrolase activator NlpD
MPETSFPLPADVAVRYWDDFGQARPGYPHEGCDLRAEEGTPLLAVCRAEVLYSGPAQGLGFETNAGNVVVLKALTGPGPIKKGDYFLYGHMKRPSNREKGDVLEAGARVGRLGNTGVSTEPHLHFAWYRGYRNPQDRGARNPYRLLLKLQRGEV